LLGFPWNASAVHGQLVPPHQQGLLKCPRKTICLAQLQHTRWRYHLSHPRPFSREMVTRQVVQIWSN
jgi:hypothetical protein